MDRVDIEQKCDRLKELIVSFVTLPDNEPNPPVKDVEEAVRLALELAKQLILDFHRIASK